MTTALLRRMSQSRTPVAATLLAVAAACWAYLFFLDAQMGDMGAMSQVSDTRSMFAMPMTSAWTGQESVLMWTMWAVMMAAMMIPSASPMVHTYDTTVFSPSAQLHGSTPVFLAGYLVALERVRGRGHRGPWALHNVALVSPRAAGSPGRCWSPPAPTSSPA